MNFGALRGWMAGEDCCVVGCGPSASTESEWDFTYDYQNRWTIGCNRAVTFCQPDFALCVEPTHDKAMWGTMDPPRGGTMSGGIMRDAAPFVVFSHIPATHSRLAGIRVVEIGPKKDIRLWFDPASTKPHALRLSQSSFYAAACAIWLGFETIGLIGVDLTEDRYPDPVPANEAYGRLAELGAEHGSRLVNLNPDSRLTTVPQATWDKVRAK